jgi:hypothetical protein
VSAPYQGVNTDQSQAGIDGTNSVETGAGVDGETQGDTVFWGISQTGITVWGGSRSSTGWGGSHSSTVMSGKSDIGGYQTAFQCLHWSQRSSRGIQRSAEPISPQSEDAAQKSVPSLALKVFCGKAHR